MNEVKRDEKGRILPGYTGNPKGRPKRKTFAEYFNEEEIEDLINKLKQALDKPDLLKMTIEQLFGKPKQEVDANVTMQTPIYGNKSVSGYNGDPTDLPADQKDKSGIGGNGSV